VTIAVAGGAEVVSLESPKTLPLVTSGTTVRGRIPDAVLGMSVFLVTEVMLFCGLISAHIVLRGPAIIWPPMGQPRLPIEVTLVNTCFLLLSGYLMLRATDAFSQGRQRDARRLLGQTLALGALFVSVQGYEWARLISFGLTTRSGLYGALFYTLVGAHGLHVIGAVTALAVVRMRPTADRLSAMKLYWLFVVGVWPALFGLVYLW